MSGPHSSSRCCGSGSGTFSITGSSVGASATSFLSSKSPPPVVQAEVLGEVLAEVLGDVLGVTGPAIATSSTAGSASAGAGNHPPNAPAKMPPKKLCVAIGVCTLFGTCVTTFLPGTVPPPAPPVDAGSTCSENAACIPESTVASPLTCCPAVTGVGQGAIDASPLPSDIAIVVIDPKITGSVPGLPPPSVPPPGEPFPFVSESTFKNVTFAPNTGNGGDELSVTRTFTSATACPWVITCCVPLTASICSCADGTVLIVNVLHGLLRGATHADTCTSAVMGAGSNEFAALPLASVTTDAALKAPTPTTT